MSIDGFGSAASAAAGFAARCRRKAAVCGLVCGALALYASSAAQGAYLDLREVQRDGVGGTDGIAGNHAVAVSPDGAHVYAAGFSENAVAAFARSAPTGLLTWVGAWRDGVSGVDGLAQANDVVVSPDGHHVYVAGLGDSAIAAFARDAGTGVLTFVEQQRDGVGGVDGLASAFRIALSPDGGHVYVAGLFDSAIAVFARNATTGALTFVEQKKDGVGGVDGLAQATSVTVSPDGAHVYATGASDAALAVFTRNPVTGALTFVEREKDGSGGVDGLAFAFDVTVSPDGAHVYTTSSTFDEAVTVFTRNPVTGALTFVATYENGVGGIAGLSGADRVRVTPDGSHVLVSSRFDHAVVVFARDLPTGTLTSVQVLLDGRPGADGIGDAHGVTVSPDGMHAYAAGISDDAVAVFGVTCGGLGASPCDDGDPCTLGDTCTAGECLGASAPPLGCRVPAVAGKASLLVKNKTPDDGDRVAWRWLKGQTTAKSDFGDPTTSDAYGLCIYDGVGLVVKAVAPAGGTCGDAPCWTALGKGFRYKNKSLGPDGLRLLVLREGLTDGKATVTADGTGPLLGLPTLTTLRSPLTVRLRNLGTGACFEATYGFPPALTNDGVTFKDRAD